VTALADPGDPRPGIFLGRAARGSNGVPLAGGPGARRGGLASGPGDPPMSAVDLFDASPGLERAGMAPPKDSPNDDGTMGPANRQLARFAAGADLVTGTVGRDHRVR